MPPSIITAEQLDLLSFFAVEPIPRDLGEPWPYNDWLYETSIEDWTVSFAVAPSYKDVRIVLKRHGTTFYELNAVGVDDLRYHSDKSGEWLELLLSARDALHLRLRPGVSLSHHLSDRIHGGTQI